MEKKRFPQYLSQPFQVLWLEADELVLALIFYTLALLFGSFFWPLVIGGPYLYSSAKKRYPRGFLKHSFYFIGLARMKGYPTFFEDEFRE
ncbi:type IV conjugative transfer system protein TraL [Candidatus Manganitrophus noduliformans]|uniref:Type IV conjugative transfer system protein TraL n=1 Tax=Candidatus Manganitrophus noduliformans TaxID=2606439 RepID=A0A7X6DNH7_9BACT|nr:type IV conjugative transfer system protein TraL [Candidatus Manganitrophus noduliformans]NKE70158.1 type IV conjugative transfer system protein TraL [Candidatus Manganitrophus noduliformans]